MQPASLHEFYLSRENRQSTVPSFLKVLETVIDLSRNLFSSNRNDNVNTTESTSSTSESMLDEVVNDVIRGRYGNGEERKKKLKEAGFDYETIQSIVNEMKRNNIF